MNTASRTAWRFAAAITVATIAQTCLAQGGTAELSTTQKLDILTQEIGALERQVRSEPLTKYSTAIEVDGDRAYRKSGKKFPPELKCTKADHRMIHGCLEPRFFDASTRVYFDSGSDDIGEVDLFNDGNLNVTVDLLSVYFPWRLGRSEFYDAWSWGPVFGAGLSVASDTRQDTDSDPANPGTTDASEASRAPVVLLSYGAMLEYKLPSGASFAFEAGRSTGYSTDESFGDIDDTATYVGLRINVPLGERPDAD